MTACVLPPQPATQWQHRSVKATKQQRESPKHVPNSAVMTCDLEGARGVVKASACGEPLGCRGGLDRGQERAAVTASRMRSWWLSHAAHTALAHARARCW
jgi:hypothetical protein